MLNEKNIQVAFQFNASNGSFVPEKIIGDIKLLSNDVRVVRQSGSDKMCIDLGYSIDAPPNDLIFKIDNQICLIKTVAQRTDLVNISLTNNEVAIITNDPNFRTLVWTSTSNLDKHLYYEIFSLNTGLSSWMFDEMAKKLNALKPDEIESNITDLKSRMQLAENELDVLDVDLAELEKKVSSLDDRLTDTESKISVAEQNIQAINENIDLLEDSISNLKTKTDTLDTRTAGINRTDTTTTIADNLKAGGTLEVIGKSTVRDLNVKGNIEVGADTVITGVLKDSEGYRYLKVRTGSIANSGRFKDMKFILRDGVATVKGNYDVAANQNVNTLDIYNFMADIIPPVIIKLNKINFYSTKKENEFYVNTTINDDTSFFINFRNTTGETKNIQYSTFNFVIECLIDVSSSNIIWD